MCPWPTVSTLPPCRPECAALQASAPAPVHVHVHTCSRKPLQVLLPTSLQGTHGAKAATRSQVVGMLLWVEHADLGLRNLAGGKAPGF